MIFVVLFSLNSYLCIYLLVGFYMALSWNEIKERAIAFSKKWADATDENAEAKPFLVDFFNVFGVSDRRVKKFEYKVLKRSGGNGYIDMLWHGNITQHNE